MYMNAYQKYIADLLDEYGSLLESQLTAMVNAKFKTNFKSLGRYIEQMCVFGDYERYGTAVCPKGTEVDFDIIRSVEVMLKFMDSIIAHNRSKGYITIRFFVNANEHNKEICIIPVRQGSEQIICKYVSDKFSAEKNEVVIFLLDEKEQMKFINVNCNCRYAVVTDKGAVFFRK